ncbi:MAG TPA: DNA starvation/stationary phase protection protein [Solirubrobacteraceae bacterium]|jgi:starvation-inducible DNA-binding protein|nr:DNA starvation/stationary phase protection protein [Solirubrobacteraceae bacterium]
MSTLSQDHHPTLRHADREAVGVELQTVLVVLTDLALIGKQLHWNIVGPHFRSLHLQLDESIDEWRLAADDVAERAVALGHSPDGRVATVAERTPLAAPDAGPLADADVVARITSLLTDAVGVARGACERVEDVDVVTADMLHGVIETLERQLWMYRVQAA